MAVSLSNFLLLLLHGKKLETMLMFIDVRKAHLIPVCNEKVFVELPDRRVVRFEEVALWNEEGRQQLGRIFHGEVC